MSVILRSSESEEEVTSLFICSRPSCTSGHCVYCLMHKNNQIVTVLREFESESSSNSVGSKQSSSSAKDNHSNIEGDYSDLEGPWVKAEVLILDLNILPKSLRDTVFVTSSNR